MTTNSSKYFKNIFHMHMLVFSIGQFQSDSGDLFFAGSYLLGLHLLVLNLEVEVATEPVVEWWGIHITGGSELKREPVFLLLLLYPHW